MALETNYTYFFERVLFESVGLEVTVKSVEFLAGGSINTAAKLMTEQGAFFIKWNEVGKIDMFESEVRGLELLRQTNCIHVPQAIATGQKEEKAYILLEYIDSAIAKPKFWEHFGFSLAQLHKNSYPSFGLSHNNYIGSLPQNNELMDDGIQFFIEKRLRVQAGLAFYNHYISEDLHKQFQRLYQQLPNLLPNEKPALLHGDLWSGNYVIGKNGLATLIDPAVYYGNREAEIAFTRLFGGFEPRFYEAYQEAFPLEKGFEDRVEIYNLYPLLVHVNLFGSGYLGGVERTLRKF